MESAQLFVALGKFSKFLNSFFRVPLFPDQILRLKAGAQVAEDRDDFKTLDIGPDDIGEEAFEGLREGRRVGVGLVDDEVFNFLGVEFVLPLEDTEGEHGGNNQFVPFQEASSCEMEGDVGN